MNYDLLLINISAIVLVLFILWWFFGSYPKLSKVVSDGPITILVKDGVYQPAYIKVLKERPVILNFLREDAAPCAEVVFFPQLDISESLPINKTVQIILPPQPSGEIEFTCQMGMYRGKIVVE